MLQVQGLLQCLMCTECLILGSHREYGRPHILATSSLFTSGSSSLGQVLSVKAEGVQIKHQP